MSFNGNSQISTSADVALNNPVDGQVLAYDGTLAKWKNNTLSPTTPSYANLPAGTLIVVDYNSVGSTYPVRPTSRTDIVVRWRGPVAPSIGGTAAIDNVDEWLNTAP